MDSNEIYFDPLTLNLAGLTSQLLAQIPPSSIQHRLNAALASISTTRKPLLEALSELLAEPAYTLIIAKLFRPILLDLAARWIDGLESEARREDREKQLAALGLLIEVHTELYPILYRFLSSPAFKHGPLNILTTHPTLITRERLHRLLLVTFRILNINRELPSLLLWDLTPLSRVIWFGCADAPVNASVSSDALLSSEAVDNGARLLAIRCYAYQSGMGEAEREKIEREVFGEIYGPECRLEYGEVVVFENGSPEIERKGVDGWVLPVFEVERIREARIDIQNTPIRELHYTHQEDQQLHFIQQHELSSAIVNVHGILHLRNAPLDHNTQLIDSDLIETPTTIHALQDLALHLSLRAPTLITSPPSSGKSLLISHLHSLLHPIPVSQPPPSNPIITIHLSDTSLDARSLLGAYTSSTRTPGQFEFKDGILVRAMKQGRWVVLEDIDKASSEVLGMVVKPLAESMRKDGDGWVGQRASLDQLGRGRVFAHDNFRVFATRSVAEGRIHDPNFLGSNKWCEVRVGKPQRDEVELIVQKKFAKLGRETVRSVVQLWEDVKSIPNLGANATEIGLRDLERFCRRLERILPQNASHGEDAMDVDVDSAENLPISSLGSLFTNPTLQEEIYLSSREVFFPFYLPNSTSPSLPAASSSQQLYYKAVADLIARHLNLAEDRRDWTLSGKVPEFDIDKDLSASGGGRVRGVRVGRTYLPSIPSKTSLSSRPTEKRPFALHKPALTLLSRLATSITLSEPLLLTGETGTGKTSVITYLSSLLSVPLISLNLSHQTEASDLIGGMKPVDIRVRAAEVQDSWRALFKSSFSQGKNEKFVGEVEDGVRLAKWKRVAGLWRESARRGIERCRERQRKREEEEQASTEVPRKRRKVHGDDTQGKDRVTEQDWENFVREVDEFDVQHIQGKGKFAFAFVEGPLIRALRNGDWVLLDEINLASPETLECISSLLQSPTSSITLTEQTSSLTPIPRHPNFRLFACMNPATDVGKKDLPPNIRSRFTEIYVPPPDADKETLISIVEGYLGPYAVGDRGAIMDVAEFYLGVKELEGKRELADGGSNKRPHFSMRTLARALTFVQDAVGSGFGFSLRRAIWEGCLMAFTMVLERERGSTEKVVKLAQKWLLNGVKNSKSLLSRDPPVPAGRRKEEFVKFGPFFLEKGPLYEGREGEEDLVEDYILTPSVERKLIDLARIVLTRRVPVLIEGPTSAGKTSSVEYLAKRTGHRFIRINNHEHTDIQEYIGSYVSDPVTGKLVFKDGLLVKALRHGDWIVLDELNLAPTDVLEALNRLLDDNRELVIPETQEVVRPHPHFMLFATQNPPGLYAGRKVLSRAFRNRFLEVHFEDVPQDELETILCQRCRIAPSYGKKIVSVFHELQKRRQSSRVFESKEGFATLRDLFRWAGRDAVGYQELAENGYMLIAERARREDDKAVVKEIIENVMNVRINEAAMYEIHNRSPIDIQSYLDCPLPKISDIIWTNAMQRLFTLISRALKFNEPILLVGETGCGKTSVCQVFASARSQILRTLNCHQNTETADLIGGLRPVRNRGAREAELLQEAREAFATLGFDVVPTSVAEVTSYIASLFKEEGLSEDHLQIIEGLQGKAVQIQSIFEWHDGPLVEAMRSGDVFLLDEISLADDSVLERLNSVLEPSRSIVLAEKGGANDLSDPTLRGQDGFKLIATMNPGGDYGKKELSPALRNRFTEIWVPRVEDRRDLELIVNSLWKNDKLRGYTPMVLDFTDWLCSRVGDHTLFSLRDILAWVSFTNSAYTPNDNQGIPADALFHHAAHMTFLDGLGSLPQLSAFTKDGLKQIKDDAVAKLSSLVPFNQDTLFNLTHDVTSYECVRFGAFGISKGPKRVAEQVFNLQAPTTQDNAMRVIRACQVPKPILLEGSPGVGKTSLITAIANIAGHELCRINLSDQTDLIDLFGSDLPIEGGSPGEFAWKDAEFLKALQEGHWVLLDEMNLAPQAVLEGLNAVLDHRGSVFIPELGRTFVRHPDFRIFAAQNPLNQGGGRKGLPKSFVNRFTKVYVEELTPNDLLLVCRLIFPELEQGIVESMVSYNIHLQESVVRQRHFAKEGSPWEFNLRDIIRWGHLLRASDSSMHPINHLRTVYLHRFRNIEDQERARKLFDGVFATSGSSLSAPAFTLSPTHLQIGHCIIDRRNYASTSVTKRILKTQLPVLESLGYCLSQRWLAILTGHRNSGKTDVVRALAQVTGHVLQEISINSATDTMDLLGSFEQVDAEGRGTALIIEALQILESASREVSGSKSHHGAITALKEAQQKPSLIRAALRTVINTLEKLPLASSESRLLGKVQSFLSSAALGGHFEWVDGPLVEAIKSGHWLLMDGANLCNPSVLDRLNSLCEHGGTLTLSERGYLDGTIQVLEPHPDFRLFMTVDPQHGELSRAMRNRGVEISILSTPTGDDPSISLDHQRLPIAFSKYQGKSSTVTFEATRRAINSGSSQASLIPISTTGAILFQDSALSSLLDHAPAVVASSQTTDTPADASIFFLGRTLSPNSLRPLARYLSDPISRYHTSHLATFLSFLDESAMSSLREKLRKTSVIKTSVPSNLTLAQPFDFYLSSPACIVESNLPENKVAHRSALQALDLAATTFLNGESQKDRSIPHRKSIQSSLEEQITNVSITFLSHLEASYHEVIDVLGSKGQANDVDLSLILSFGRYSQHLRQVICNDSLDFSALQAICQLLNHLVDNAELTPRNLGISFKALRDSLALKKGVGLFDIWSGTYIDPKAGYITRRYDASTEKHAPRVAQGLRRRTLDFLALSTLPAEISQENVEKIQLLQQELEPASTEPVQESPNGSEDPILIIAKLSLFPAVLVSPQLASESLQETIKMSVYMGGSLSKVARLQHLVWQIEAGHNVIPTLLRSQLEWFEDLWQSSDVSNRNLNGPSTLLMPCALASTLTICNLSERTLNNSPVVESDLLEHGRAVRLHVKQRNNRLHQLNDLFQLSLSTLANCFTESRRATQVRDIVEAFAKSGRDEIGNAFARHFNNETPNPTPNPNSREGTIMTLAQVWANLGKVVADLFIPDSPVDPLAVEDFVIQYRKKAHESLSHQIRHHLQLEKLTTGANTNGCIEYLEAQLGLLVDTLPSNRTRYMHARDALRVRSFWSEVTQFRDQIIMSSKLSGLLESLLGGDSTYISQEETTQHSMAGFAQRLDSIYGDLEDLVTPVKLSIHFLRLGLRLAAYYALLNGDDPAFSGSARTITALTSYPTITSISNLSKDGPLPGISPFRRILLTLSAINAERSISCLKETRLEAVERSYEQALRLWNIDLSKQAEADMAANSLYRKQKTDYEDVGEAELEEKEFLALFPSFEDVLDTPSSDGDASSHSRSTTYVTPIDIETLLQHHYQLLAEDRFPQAPTSNFLGIRASILDSLVNSSLSSLSDELDSSSVHLQVWAIWKQVQFLRNDPTHSTSSYDFYRTSNVPELQKAYTVVSALRTRLSTIIEDWPEQMVLHHLREKCDLILGLRLHSPVAKVLAALEQLLLQTKDWEMYANRDNTIKVNQNELIQLIVSWRRLELLSWQGLLDSQAQDYEKEVAPWWFRLYDATIRGPLAALADDNPDGSSQYLRTLVPLLSDFIQTSTLGQFRARMRLLQSFEDYVHLIRGHKDQSQQNLLLRIGQILESTRQAFDIFSSTIATHLAAERSKLEKEIRDFIKLASWKDVNVQALKASAQKTHHQLYKIVRKFRETLKQPASSLFSSPTTETTDTAPLPASSVSIDCDGTLTSVPPAEVAEHFTKDLPWTINQFHQIVNSRIQVAIDSRRANLADDLAVNIIVTANDLAAISVSGGLDGEARRKQQKALLVRKRKAWSDLLKELKRAGFTANVRPEVLHRHTDSLWLKDQPRLVKSLEPGLNSTKCEGYLYRLHTVLPQLRASLSDHHSDISTRELKRGSMFVESVFAHGIELRSSLVGSLENYNTLSRAAKRLFALATTPLSPYCGPKLPNIVHSVYNALAQASSALNDVLDVSEAYNGLKPEELIPAALIADIETLKRSTITLRDQTLTLMDEFHAITQPFLTIDEENLVTASIEHLSNVSRKLRVISGEHPTLEFIFAPVSQWLDSQELDHLPNTNADIPQETQSLDPLINGFLIIIQNVLSRCPPTTTTHEEQDDDQYLSRSVKMVGEITQALNMQSILSLLDSALPFLLSDPRTAQNKILAIKPFLDTYLALVKAQLCSHLNWTTALLKLDFVLTSIMKRLAKEGFCQPPESSDQGDEGDGGEATGGMGLGAGTGTENVSKEIEDESQVEGLKGDEGEKQDKDQTSRDDKGTIEMSEDIGGELEDVSEADEDEERESDDGSEADPEERIEDLDPKDPNAVDEKLWGDEKGPDDGGKDDEKLDQDRSEEKEGDSEVVAKDGEKKQSKEKQKPANQKVSEGDQGSEEEDHTGADMEEDVEEPNANGAPMDEHLPDAITLDLPEDMDLGEEMKQDDDSLSGMDEDDGADAMGEEEIEDIPELPGEQDKHQETWAQEDQPPELDPDAMDQDEGPEQNDQPKETADDQNDQEAEERNGDENEATARPDISTGDGATANEHETDPTLGDSATSGQAGGTQDTSGQHNTGMETQPTEQQSSTQPLDQQAQDTEAQSSESQTAGAATSGAQEGQAPSQPETSIKTNPLRSLGDALNEVRQHFDDILSPEHRDRPKEQVGDVSNPSQLEYLQPDDADHDMQALGSAGEEQVAKLNELKLIDEEEQPGEAAPMDIDMPMGEENIQPPQPRETFRHEDLTAQDRRDDIEGAIQQSSNPATTQPSLSSSSEDFTRKVDPELLEEMEQAAEASLREWQSQGFPEAGGEKIWRTYESLTHDLAYALCEQLRLILEPTLATRLKGDYRTGKRLNMKKIISYIASDYTKDKIWLRRTRPSQREYQVLISIDDSRSMAESHSIHLAFETLALVSKALSRLESGDIAIAKFGETVDILHGFDEGPFTDQAGTKVMNAFHFNQKATNVLSLVETSLKVLEKARERRATSSATAGDLWQLQFVISDGMCQDHEKLRTVLRKAEEQRVMIVFVILDSLHSTTGVASSATSDNKGAAQGSILTMDKAEFKNVDGRMELVLQKYLDSFPFEYYVVLRNVEALPEVLASTLKQFFERITEE